MEINPVIEMVSDRPSRLWGQCAVAEEIGAFRSIEHGEGRTFGSVDVDFALDATLYNGRDAEMELTRVRA